MRSPNRICTLEQIQVCMLQRRVFRQCNFLIIENNPSSITFDMSNIMATSCIFPNVRNSVFAKGQFHEIAKVLETISCSLFQSIDFVNKCTYIPTMLYFPSPSSGGALDGDPPALSSFADSEAMAPSKSSICENNQSAARSAAPLVSLSAART